MKRDRVTVIFNLFAETVCQARKAAHPHAHCEVLPFDVAGGDMLGVRVSGDGSSAASDTGCGAVTGLREIVRHPVNLHEH